MTQDQPTPRGPLTAVLDLFSSIWLGISLMVAIFLYASIGSAIQPFNPWDIWSPREYFEKSEMEWFTWWPFNLLIALLCINLVVVTLRRIPLRVTTLGVWMIHTGIIILAIGSVYYFGRKIEADTPVFRRRVTIQVPGVDAAELVVRPGNQMKLKGTDGKYAFAIKDIEPAWAVPGTEDEKAFRLVVDVTTPATRYTRTMVAGHPQLTADVMTGSRTIEIKIPGAPKSTFLETAQHSRVEAVGAAGRYEFHVQEVNPNWPLMTGEDRGKTTTSISVTVQTPKETFIRQLLLGYPQYTEDVIPGSGRAVKVIGRKLIDEDLELLLHERPADNTTAPEGVVIDLDFVPQRHAFLAESSALYLRESGAPQWDNRPIDDLPHFRDFIVSFDHVAGNEAKSTERGLDIPLEANGATDPLADYRVVVDGFLRYAELRRTWVDSGPDVFPVASARLTVNGRARAHQLVAFDERRQVSEDGWLGFLWAESQAKLEEALQAAWGSITINIPAKNVVFRAPSQITDEFNPITGTDWHYRIVKRHDHAGSGNTFVVVVEVKTPESVITRWAAKDASKTRDSAGHSTDGSHEFTEPDPRFTITYTPSPLQPFTIVSGESLGTHVISLAGVGNPVHIKPQAGELIELGGDTSLTIDYIYSHALPRVLPAVTPMHRRHREVARDRSYVHVVIAKDQWQREVWVPFNNYALPNEQYGVPGKIKYDPRLVRLPDGRQIELMFSRQQVPLPAAVVLDDFTLKTHQGGLIGQNSNVRDYISMLRFQEPDGQWSEPVKMSLNAPAMHNGYWYFQSIWDAPSRQNPGMNFTGCGVGTRDGVYTQLVGTCIAVFGMVYAFYVKPAIIRRRRLAVYADLESEGGDVDSESGADGEAAAAQATPDVRVGSPVGVGARSKQEQES